MSESPSEPLTNDCYSSGERGWMEYGQRLRARWLGPLLWTITRVGVGPDCVTLLSGIVGLGFVPAWLMGYSVAAIACLAVHCLLDGLDGPCARYQGVASPRGSFTDTFTDQIVVTAVTVAWMIGHSSPWAIGLGGFFIFFYTLVVAMAMVLNALAVSFSWLVRPRFFFFAALAIESAGVPSITYATLLGSCLLLAAKSVTGFIRLRQKIPGP